jgi:hypothetical protein
MSILPGWFECLLRGIHDPARHPLGGMRCTRCGHAADDFSEMGFGLDSGYVPVIRRVYDRDKGLTRTSEWEATRRGW